MDFEHILLVTLFYAIGLWSCWTQVRRTRITRQWLVCGVLIAAGYVLTLLSGSDMVHSGHTGTINSLMR